MEAYAGSPIVRVMKGREFEHGPIVAVNPDHCSQPKWQGGVWDRGK